MKECKLMDKKGVTVAMGSRDQMTRYLKHHVADGMYAIEGPGINMNYYRFEGVVYPRGGSQDGLLIQPRTLKECIKAFQQSS